MASQLLRKRNLRRKVTPYLLILPTSLLLVVFVYGVVIGVLQGFGIAPFLGMLDFTTEYWEAALTRADLVQSIGYSLYLAFFSSLLALVGGVVLSAALVNIKASRTLQLFVIQVPLIAAHTLAVLFIISIFSGSGLFPRALYALGLISEMGDFPSVVGDPTGWGIFAVYFWKEVPFIAFCTITIMANVSSRFGEAAATHGSSPLRTFFTITLPLCRSALVKAFLVVFAFIFGSYEVPYLLGPTLPKTLPVLAYIEYSNPNIANRCMSMAIDGVMVLITVILAIIYFKVMNREAKGRY